MNTRSRGSLGAALIVVITVVTSSAVIAADTPLISRAVLFGNPDKSNAQLSPDGAQLAYLAPVGGVMNIWIGAANNPAVAKPITQDTHRGIRAYFWAYTNRHIVYVQDRDGDENWHIYCVDLRTGESRDLTPVEGVMARIQDVSRKYPQEILVGLNDRDPQLHDLYRINIETGQRTLILENHGYTNFVTDDDFEIRFGVAPTPFGGKRMMRRTTEGAWKLFAEIEQEDGLTTGPLGFDKHGNILRMIDSRDRDTAALTEIDPLAGDQVIIAEDPRADISDALIHPTEKTIQAAAFTLERKHWKILDTAIEPDLKYLRGVADGDFEIVSRTLDDQAWLVAYILDNGPVRYYYYDRAERKSHLLFSSRAALESLPLARMHPLNIKSRDGLNLVSYLSLPVESDTEADSRPAQPLPMVLMVHGGPWARDNWGYDAFHQWLANRGYAVLSVNYRGSTGFGKKFINAADKEVGGKMHDDLIDAVEWAITQRIADPHKVAIMGASYGGYAALWGLTSTPEVFACGVDICGPSSLVTLLESVPPYMRPMLDMLASRIGDHRTEAGRKLLVERSPLTHVARICRPLLIGQGANDPRVKQAESDQIVQAMREKSIPVTYVLFPDEGHGFQRPENRLAFNAIAEAFLAKHLGGRVEPIGDDFIGSSVKVPAGAEQVPGVIEAMQT
ncbi:MAG: S9 family peptidase [Planctomycetota bacterium]